MTFSPHSLACDARFRQQAWAFAKWYGLERRAALALGRIAASWLQHYSRSRNAERFAEALCLVTGLRITGRSIMNYRAIYLLDQSWRASTRGCRAESRNDFEIRHVSPGHLRVVAAAKLPDGRKHDLLDEAERKRFTVKQTVGRARQLEVLCNRSRRSVRTSEQGPVVYHGDAIDVLAHVHQGSIHHCFCDWQWSNVGTWQENARVYRPQDPVAHLCRFLTTVYPYLSRNAIVWVFSKTTAFEGGAIGLPWDVQKAAYAAGLRYASEYIAVHKIAGYRSKNTFLAIKHTPLHAFVPEGFDFRPVEYAFSVGRPLSAPSRISQRDTGQERHPYQKPVELFEDLICLGSPGGLVFDAFAGSGAAGVAAVRQGCPYVGAELETHYVQAANRAIANALAKNSEAVQSA